MISLKNTLKAITSKFTALNTLLNDVPHYTLLWTNPNPSSSFSAQTISLDLSKYDAVLIIASFYGGNGRFSCAYDTNFSHNLMMSHDKNLAWRGFSLYSDKIEFSNSSFRGAASTSTMTANDTNIPEKIYGIKFGGGV